MSAAPDLAFGRGRRLAAYSVLPAGLFAALAAVLATRQTGVPSPYLHTLAAMDGGQCSWLFPCVRPGAGLIDKPPLFFWLAAAAGSIFGRTTWAPRLPDLVAALAVMPLLRFGLRRCSGWAGPAAVAVLVSTPAWLTTAGTTPMEPLLALGLLGSLVAVDRGRYAADGRDGRAAHWWYLLAGACWGLAFATKEWAAVPVLPACAVMACCGARGKRPWVSWLTAVGVGALISAAWPLAVTVAGSAMPASYGGSPWRTLVGYNLLSRLSQAGFRLPIGDGNAFAPPVPISPTLTGGPLWWCGRGTLAWWFASLPLAAGMIVKVARGWRSKAVTAETRWVAAAAVWLVCVLATYALVHDPLPQYLDETTVPLSILAGAMIGSASSGPLRRLAWGTAVGAWVTAVGALAGLGVMAGLPVSVGVVVAMLTWGRRPRPGPVCLSIVMASGVLLETAVLVLGRPAIDWGRINRMVAANSAPVIVTGDVWAAGEIAWATGKEALPLVDNYTQRTVLTPRQLRALEESGQTEDALITGDLRLTSPAVWAWVEAHAGGIATTVGPYRLLTLRPTRPSDSPSG
ncbi:MAG: ArnT family glycosyltransferase [Chloroflexota bacterium]